MGTKAGMRIAAAALAFAVCFSTEVLGEQDDEPEHLPYWESDQDIESARDREEISVELSEELQELLDNPLDVNKAGAGELAALPGLEISEAQRIVSEREENGEYESARDLLERQALTLETYRKIRMFVTAVPRASWLKTRGELRQEFFTSPYEPDETDESVSALSMRTRVKGTGLKGRYRAGGTFLTDHRTLSRGFEDQRLKLTSVRDSRWVKTYAGYDPMRGTAKKSGPFYLKQAYIGNYRAGFFDGIEREKPAKFYPDERMNEPGSIEVNSDKRRAAPLKGAAVQLAAARAEISAYYSKNNYPTLVPTSAAGGLNVSSAAVDDALDMEISGARASYPITENLNLAIFLQKQKAARKIGPEPGAIFDNRIWGSEMRNRFGDWHARFAFSRSDHPVSGRNPNFYFARIGYESAAGRRWTVLYKNLGRGYYNPAGSFFTGDYLWKFSSRLSQELGPAFGLRLDYSEMEKITSGVAFRRQEAAFQLRFYASPELTVQWGERYRAPGPVGVAKTFTEDGTLKSVRIDAADELRSSLRLRHRAARGIETRLGFDLLARNMETGSKLELGQFLTAGAGYKPLDELEVRAQAEFNDPGLSSSNNETQSWACELRSTPLKNIDLRLRWRNQYRLREQKIDGNGIQELIQQRAISENSFSLRLVARW